LEYRSRVARWFVFKPKIQIWEKFGEPCNVRCWYILWTLGLLTVFCYILWTFVIVRGYLVYFFPFWYFVPRKIWQPCIEERFERWYRSLGGRQCEAVLSFPIRVTRLGEFSHIVRLLSLDRFVKITEAAQILGLLFSTRQVMYSCRQNGDFFSHSSGHPVPFSKELQQKISIPVFCESSVKNDLMFLLCRYSRAAVAQW
jgi:hypothetical protein